MMNFVVLPNKYSIYRFKVNSKLPDWIYSSDFYSLTKTKDELSVIATQQNFVLDDIVINNDWRILKIIGPLEFSLIGIIADVSLIFKERRISIFTISTYDTDYILVKQKDLNLGLEALREKGHIISIEN
jgi:uncharacterized protein